MIIQALTNSSTPLLSVELLKMLNFILLCGAQLAWFFWTFFNVVPKRRHSAQMFQTRLVFNDQEFQCFEQGQITAKLAD